jgi:broad specificity phosphatase PhoE
MELYLLRHGQAGTRDDYDRLSEVGRRQVERLAEQFAGRGISFDRVVSGGLQRQRSTAEIVTGGGGFAVDERWSEFDLDGVYRWIAPRLAEVDAEFRLSYEEVRRESEDPGHAVHRTWKPADMAVVRAWVEGRFPGGVESWAEFVERVRGGLAALEGRRVLVSTSATPIGLVTAGVFGRVLPQAFQLAGALYNSSLTVLKQRQGAWELSQFNLVGHLDGTEWLTLR